MQLFACYHLLLSAYLLGVVDTAAPEAATSPSASTAAMIQKENQLLQQHSTSPSANAPVVHQHNVNLNASNVDKGITSTHEIVSPQGKDVLGRKSNIYSPHHRPTRITASILSSSRVLTQPPNNNNNNNGSNSLINGFLTRTINGTDDITDDTLPSNTTNATTPTYPPGEAPSYSPNHRAPSPTHRHSAGKSIRADNNMKWRVLKKICLATSTLLVLV